MRWKGVSPLRLPRAEPPRYGEAFLEGLGRGRLPTPPDWYVLGRKGEEGDEYILGGHSLFVLVLLEGSLAGEGVQRTLGALAKVVGLETPPSPALPGAAWEWVADAVDAFLEAGEAEGDLERALERALEGDEGAVEVLEKAMEEGGWVGQAAPLFVQGLRLAQGRLPPREIPLPQNLEALLEALEEAPAGEDTLPGLIIWEEGWPGWETVRELVEEAFQTWWKDEWQFAHLVAENEEEARRAGQALRAALEVVAWLGEIGGDPLPRKRPTPVRGKGGRPLPLLELARENLLPPAAAPLPGAEGMVD